MVRVITSASCFTAFSKALMMVFKPEKREARSLEARELINLPTTVYILQSLVQNPSYSGVF